ncbi:MAG: 50S ribosomal protein L11 methyltransferase [Bacteroidota bacterium]
MTYLEYNFTISPVQPFADLLAAELGEMGFESFEVTDTGLLAYVSQEEHDEQALEKLWTPSLPEVTISWQVAEIPKQNWNAKWEENFNPIEVDDQILVRAPFHEAKTVPYDIVIEPKMSFGTGHHETTYMMLQLLLDEVIEGKTVLDMGCGTGVLAILAKMRGATSVDAVDIDEWCYLNTIENIERNHCDDIQVYQGDKSVLVGKSYDIIIANINKNILLQDMSTYVECLHSGGTLLLSGFYEKDLEDISKATLTLGLAYQKHNSKNDWVAAVYRKG